MPTKAERMPMWLAVGISVVVGLPFGLLLKGFSVVLWIVFTVWAVYLNFGGTIAGARRLIPAYVGGAVSAALVHMLALLLSSWITTPHLTFDNGALVIPVAVAYFVGFCVAVWWMKFSQNFQVSALAYFSGISLTLGAIFTGLGNNSYIGHNPNQYVYVIGALIVSVLSCAMGCLIAYLSVWLNGAAPPASDVGATSSDEVAEAQAV